MPVRVSSAVGSLGAFPIRLYLNQPPFLCFALPEVSRVIQVDLDVEYRANIRELFQEFDNFPEGAVIGIAQEMQPVYRYVAMPGTVPLPGPFPAGPPEDRGGGADQANSGPA